MGIIKIYLIYILRQMSLSKCSRINCNFLVHDNINNNRGTHCCRACKRNGKHGQACQKKLVEETNIVLVEKTNIELVEKKIFDMIISINIYDNFNFLKKQLYIIKKNILCSYCVILHCNNHMFFLLKSKSLPNNIYINPHILNKKRFHGSLTHGIVSNMKFALKNFQFKYFIILSSRTIFYRQIKFEYLDVLNKKLKNLKDLKVKKFNENNWHWPSIRNTLLAKYYLKKGYYLYRSAHEGLCFSFNVVDNIINFLNKQTKIRNDLFNFNHCVEEFALQTISMNQVNKSNLEYGFINIGHGVTNKCDFNAKNKFVRKIDKS